MAPASRHGARDWEREDVERRWHKGFEARFLALAAMRRMDHRTIAIMQSSPRSLRKTGCAVTAYVRTSAIRSSPRRWRLAISLGDFTKIAVNFSAWSEPLCWPAGEGRKHGEGCSARGSFTTVGAALKLAAEVTGQCHRCSELLKFFGFFAGLNVLVCIRLWAFRC